MPDPECRVPLPQLTPCPLSRNIAGELHGQRAQTRQRHERRHRGGRARGGPPALGAELAEAAAAEHRHDGDDELHVRGEAAAGPRPRPNPRQVLYVTIPTTFLR